MGRSGLRPGVRKAGTPGSTSLLCLHPDEGHTLWMKLAFPSLLPGAAALGKWLNKRDR